MKKTNTCIRNIVVSLILGMSTVTLAAYANDINKVDIKKSNNNGSALNVTIYTSNPYDENVAVSKKGDNKYVILMPNTSGANTSNVDFSSIKDVVSDVNVKSVNDGAGGYTKVTLTTTKPVSISTSTRKSAPLTEEQKAYKNLIAQSRGYTQNNKQSTQTKPKATVETVNAAAPIQKDNAPMIFTTPAPETKVAEHKAAPKESKESVIDKVKNIVDASAGKTNTASGNTDKSATTSVAAATTTKTATASPAKVEHVKDSTLQDLRNDIIAENNQKAKANQISDNKSENITETTSTTDIQAQTQNKGFNKNMLTSLIILLVSLFGITALFRAVKKSLEHSIELKRSFKENLKEQPHPEIADYSDIADDTSLNWQEKYQKFMSSIEEIKPEDGIIRHIGNGEYEFVNSIQSENKQISNIYGKSSGITDNTTTHAVSNLKPAQKPKLTSYNKPAINSAPDIKPIKKVKNQNLKTTKTPRLEIVERKSEASGKADFKKLVSKLERTFANTPSEEQFTINTGEEVILKQFEGGLNDESGFTTPVHREEDYIIKAMKNSSKLKSFDHKTALETTRRKVARPKRSSEIIKTRNIESKYVNLENSSLYSSARKFQDANLSSADLISNKSIGSNVKLPKGTVPQRTDNFDYTMATIDEFFEPSGVSYATAPASLSNRVADSLARISRTSSNDSQATSNETRTEENKSVNTSYKIDSSSGFYITTNEHGTSSLIGYVNGNSTVIKEFNRVITDKLQVRKDSPNVYMVRVGSERFLVEVNGNRMGVLIAL